MLLLMQQLDEFCSEKKSFGNFFINLNSFVEKYGVMMGINT